jgi:hypothetical protein
MESTIVRRTPCRRFQEVIKIEPAARPGEPRTHPRFAAGAHDVFAGLAEEPVLFLPIGREYLATPYQNRAATAVPHMVVEHTRHEMAFTERLREQAELANFVLHRLSLVFLNGLWLRAIVKSSLVENLFAPFYMSVT